MLSQCLNALEQLHNDAAANDVATATLNAEDGGPRRIVERPSFHCPLHRLTAWLLHEACTVLPDVPLRELMGPSGRAQGGRGSPC